MILQFAAELEKIARKESIIVEMGLKPKPWDLGIYSKKQDRSHRLLATTGGVGSAAVFGGVGAAGLGALSGGPNAQRFFTSAGRKKIVEEGAKDIGTLSGASLRAKEKFIEDSAKAARPGDVKAQEEFKKKLREAKGLGKKLSLVSKQNVPKAVEKGVLGAAKSYASPAVKELVTRRLKGSGKAALFGAATLGGVVGLSNLAKYEAGRMASPPDAGLFAARKRRRK